MPDPMAIQSHIRSLDGLRPIQPAPRELGEPVGPQGAGGGAEGPSFGDVLADSIREVNELQNNADEAIRNLATGESGNIHQTMIEMKKAEVSMRMLVEVRNKVISAYQDVMRMQV